MKNLLITLFLFSISSLSAQFDWLRLISSAPLTESEYFLGVTVGPGGETYSVGAYEDVVGSSTRSRPYLVKHATTGNQQYDQILGGNATRGTAYDVDYDPVLNQVIVGGSLNGEPYLAFIDPTTGVTLNTATINGSGIIKAIEVTPTHIYAVGNYSGTLGFPPVFSIFGGSAFVAQFDLNGNPIRAINVQALNAKGFDVKVDALDQVYFTLTTQADIVFGTGFTGNYTYSGSGEDQILVRANNQLRADWSVLMNNSAFPLSAESELPLVLDEGSGTAYAAVPYEPNTMPRREAKIAGYQMSSGGLLGSTDVAGRTVRDLTVSCGNLSWRPLFAFRV